MATRHSCTSSGSIEVMVEGSSVTVTMRSVGEKTCGDSKALPVQPDRNRAAVRCQPFGRRQRNGRTGEGGKRAGVAAEHGGALHEIEHAKSRGEAGRARRRQHVVGAAD